MIEARKSGRLLALAVAGAAMWAPPVRADDGLAACRTAGPAQIAACSTIIADPASDAARRVQALLFRSEAIRRTGDNAATLADLEQAQTLAPEDPDVLIHFAKFHYDNRELAQAERYIRQAASVAPQNPVPQNVWGKILYLRDDYAGAIARFRAALALDPDHANSRWNLANALVKTGDLRGALAEYEICEKQFPAGRQKTNAGLMILQIRQKLAQTQ